MEASAAALLNFLPLPQGRGSPHPQRRRILLAVGVDPAPLMAHEAGSLMEAVTFVPFQEPGLEFHHAEGVIGAALAGEDPLEAIPAGVGR